MLKRPRIGHVVTLHAIRGHRELIMNADQVLDSIDNKTEDDARLFTTKSGVVFNVLPISLYLLRDAIRRLEAPKPPLVHIEDKDTFEENPNDPDYRTALDEFNIKRIDISGDVALYKGTTVRSLPENFPAHTDNEWREELIELSDGGIQIPESGPRRYLAWIRYVAASHSEVMDMHNKVMKVSGHVTEADVENASESFRDNEERDTAPSVPTTEASGSRARVRALPRNSA